MRTIGFIDQGASNDKTQNLGFAAGSQNGKILKADKLIIPCEFTHAAIIGETGCGKTTSMIYPNLLDRMQRGHAIFVFDYKGCEKDSVIALAKRANRLKDVVCIGTLIDDKINLIQDMLPRDFKNSIASLMKTNDTFWQEYGANSVLNIFNYLKALDEYVKKVNELGGSVDSYHKSMNSKYGFNITTIRDLTQDYFYFSEFLKNVKERNSICSQKETAVRLRYKELQNAKENLIKTFLKFYFSNERDTDRAQKDFFNLAIMSTVLIELADNRGLNAKEGSIASLLNSGKIVVFDALNASQTALCMLLDSFLPKLILRAGKQNLTPISVFLDETSKLASHNTNFQEEILRQSKVELILSFQNEAVLKREIGETKYEALMGNIVSVYLMKNRKDFTLEAQSVNCSELERFECLHDGKRYAVEPIFIDQAQKGKAIAEYEKINKLQEKMLKSLAKGYYMKFDEERFKNGEIILINAKTDKEKIGELNDAMLGLI